MYRDSRALHRAWLDTGKPESVSADFDGAAVMQAWMPAVSVLKLTGALWARALLYLQSWREGGRALAVRDGLQPGHCSLWLILQPCAPAQPLPPPPAPGAVIRCMEELLKIACTV